MITKDTISAEIKYLDTFLKGTGLRQSAILESGFTEVTYYNMLQGKGWLKNLVKMRNAQKKVISEMEKQTNQ